MTRRSASRARTAGKTLPPTPLDTHVPPAARACLGSDTVAERHVERTVAESNRTYFLALAATRGALSNLRLLAILTAVFFGLDTFVGLNALIYYEGARSYLPLFNAHVVFLGLSVFLVMLSSFKRLIHRYQAFFSYVMAGLAALMVYGICMMTLTLTSFDGARGQGLNSALFGMVGAATAVLVAGSAVVHVWLLRRRLRAGHSEKRTMANFEAISKASRSKTLWIAFAFVMIVPNVVTQGQYFLNTFGAISLVFLAVVLPSLPVELTYLAYLKSHDRGYWERLPRLSAKRRQALKVERLRLAKRAVMWVLIAIALVALIWVLNILLPMWLG